MKRLATALILGLIATTGGLGQPAPAAASASNVKVVIVVGAVQGTTSSYRADADQAASVFAKYTSNVIKVYSPNATWSAVQQAAAGANIFIYLGHGSGFPNPYVKYLQPNGDNGMGLNSSAGNGDSDLKYYGENYMAQLGLAPNALVLLNHLCYASGDNEPGRGLPTLSVAKTRVDGYASGFLRGNARAVIADGLSDLSWYIDTLFTTHQSIEQLWSTASNFHNNVTMWDSTRNAGDVSRIDPDINHPQSDGDYYYRSLVLEPGLTTDEILTGLPATPPSPTTYHAMTPVRIFDTRDNTGTTGGALKSHVARGFTVRGAGGVPNDAAVTAVTGNLTVTQQSSGGFLYLGPLAMNDPTVSNLNFPKADDRANAITVALSGDGKLYVTFAAPVRTTPSAHAVFDVTGYFTKDTSGATFHPLSPARILDSRDGTGGVSGAIASHHAVGFPVRGAGNVPNDAKVIAVTGNLTVTQQSSLGFLYLGPSAQDDPTSSNINFPKGDDRANSVTVALSGDGKLYVTYAAPIHDTPVAHVIFDVTGYFTADATGAMYVPLNPSRILDTRSSLGGVAVLHSHQGATFSVWSRGGVPSSNAIAVTGNLTVTGQSSGGFLYLGPTKLDDPTSSNLNFPKADDRANAVTVALSGDGKLSVTYAAPTHDTPTAQAIFDVTGYFTPGS